MRRTTSVFNKKTRFMIVDIETCDTFKTKKVMINDISFGVWSAEEGFLFRSGYIVKENRRFPLFYSNKYPIYDEYIRQGIYSISTFEEIMQALNEAITLYNPVYACAYNSTFDLPHIEKACAIRGMTSPLARLKEFDLFPAACETIGQQKLFRRFIHEHGFYTAKGNRSSGAETMYRYIRNWPDFEEEHTGYSDIEIEAEILRKVQRQKKKLSFRATNQAWRLVQN